MKKRQVFKDNKQEKIFQQQGYIVLPLLNFDEVNALSDFYVNNSPKNLSNFHSTHFSNNRLYKKQVQKHIFDVFDKHVTELFIDYQPVFGNFMVKEPGEGSIMPLHADWTYVDEKKHQSLAIWCTLTNTNQQNGMLGVVPKSHNFKITKRGPKIPSPFNEYNQYIIDNYGKLLPMKAGEIVVYDHRTLHFSPPNLSDTARIAINLVACPSEADIQHFTLLNNDEYFECFNVNSNDFFVEYDCFEKPSLASPVRTEKLVAENYTQTYIDSVLKNKSLLKNFLNFFKA